MASRSQRCGGGRCDLEDFVASGTPEFASSCNIDDRHTRRGLTQTRPLSHYICVYTLHHGFPTSRGGACGRHAFAKTLCDRGDAEFCKLAVTRGQRLIACTSDLNSGSQVICNNRGIIGAKRGSEEMLFMLKAHLEKPAGISNKES